MLKHFSRLNKHPVFLSVMLFLLGISTNALSVKAQDSLKDGELRRNYERATELLKSAKSEASKGRYDLAIDFATRALDYSASKEFAYFERAKIYVAKKEYENAVNDYTECIKLGERNSTYYNARAQVYGLMKRYGDAISDYSEVIRLNPKSLSGYENRANAYFQMKLYDEAINDITEVIGGDPKASYYRLRALSFRELKDYENAILDFNHALELSPKSAELYCERGQVYFVMENFDEALRDAKKALYYDPASVEAKKLEAESAKKSNEKAQGKPPEKQNLL